MWNEKEPFQLEGAYWNAVKIETTKCASYHLEPFQKPHPPISVTELAQVQKQ